MFPTDWCDARRRQWGRRRVHDTPTRDGGLRAYITVSRAEDAENLNIGQPYAPMLFHLGP